MQSTRLTALLLGGLARTRPCHAAVTAALAAAASTVDLVRDGIYAFP
jgi:hypothetical protein